MNASQLLDRFERISDAPDAIPRLRRFILDLAVRGKLVDQDPHDEPASNLVRRIQAEKTRLKAGEGRRRRPLPPVARDEVPFELPVAWVWARAREVTGSRGQIIPTTDFTYIDVTAINKELGRIAGAKVISASDAPSRARKLVQKGDVIYSCVRPYLLNIAVIESDFVPAPIASTAFAVLDGFGLIAPRYLWVVFRSSFMVECVEANMRGQAYPAINDEDFALLPLPLPPLIEQHRIVAKVDELMALCDRLEAAQTERERRRDRLTAASLHRLKAPAHTPAFREHADFHLRHLARFTTRPDQIPALREAVLNLAVGGQLVRQDPNDEPASELVKRIQSERVRIGKQRGESQRLPLPIAAEETPSAIPDGWEWARVGDVLLGDSQNGYSKKPDDALDGIPILRISAGTVRKDGVVAEEEHKLIGGVSAAQREQYQLQPGDLLACRFNGNRGFVGRLSLYSGYLGIKPIYPDKLIRLRLLSQFVLPKLVRCFSESSLIRKDVETYSATTVGNWGISASNLKKVKIPLPPLAEQHRIVAKVDELMAMCDRLEAQLTTAQTESRRLLEAVLHEAL